MRLDKKSILKHISLSHAAKIREAKKRVRRLLEQKQYFVYILRCKDQTLYTGWTTNLERRINEHNSEKSKTKYTRARRPVSLVYFEELNDKSLACKREYQIKQLSKKEKESLICQQQKKI